MRLEIILGAPGVGQAPAGPGSLHEQFPAYAGKENTQWNMQGGASKAPSQALYKQQLGETHICQPDFTLPGHSGWTRLPRTSGN